MIVPYPDASMKAMEMASAEDTLIKERYESYLLRVPEELYDWSSDPGSWHNLAGDPEYLHVLNAARSGLLQWMKSSGDPLAEFYQSYVDAQ